MKPKDIRIMALIFAVIMIGGVMWWLAQAWPVFVDVQIHAVPAVKGDAPKAVVQYVQAAQVEMPKAAAVAANGGKIDSPAEDAALVQAELKATVQDMARIAREEGSVALAVKYYSPDFIAKQPPGLVQRMLDDDAKRAQDPQEQLRRENLAQRYDKLATLTPTLNATDNKATYYGQAGDKNAYYNGSAYVLARFAKINGKWYWVSYLGDDPSDPYP